MAALTAIAIGAVASGVAAVGSTIMAATSKPPPPPPPASYYSYDAEGNPAGSQVWDAEKNAYVYKPAPLTEEQMAENAKRTKIRQEMLDNLDKTPEDRVKFYQDYAETFMSSMQRTVDREFTDTMRAIDESMNARGLTGSSADVDLKTRLVREKAQQDERVAESGELAAADLAERDRQFWLETLGYLDAGKKSDEIIGLEKAHMALTGAQLGSASLLGGYTAENDAWKARQEKLRSTTSDLLNTSAGLAFLYGYNKPGGTTKPSSIAPNGGAMKYYNTGRMSLL